MVVLKCKMCGGDLNVQEGMTVCECEYCGTRQTVPNIDDEKKLTLFARANRLRAANEFDKAFGIYESIVADFPEEAEAYWGLLLCKYGIEYVDDPKTGKKIPTCHRSSFTSILEDPDFDQVMENSDVTSRAVYREEAKQIEELRIRINEVSSKEEPYDIFICYKETDVNGDRTVDSVIAQDVYQALTDKGYKVFFSRITLEDKLGQEYEPYIFAALNSAKVMLAFGTDYENYNAVWVKNEWSRFLSLIEKGAKKTLIPCYKDIDAYDMPMEFRRLQAQDMGKVGAMQDLLRGIEKIIPKNGPSSEKEADLSEKDKRRNGPSLISNVKIVGANDANDTFPGNTPASTIDLAEYSYLAVQINFIKDPDSSTLPYGFSVYDSLGNQVYTFSNSLELEPTWDTVSKVWPLKENGKPLYDIGKYRIEAWVYNSRMYEYNFNLVDSSSDKVRTQANFTQDQPAEKSYREQQLEKRKNGPRLIRGVLTVGADNGDDVFPKRSPSTRIDARKFTHLAMEMILHGPIGRYGTATYNYTIYDSLENPVLNETRELQVIPNYDRFSLVWKLRTDDNYVAPGDYTLDVWIDNSSIFTHKFTVIDSAAPYNGIQPNQPSGSVNSSLQNDQTLQLLLERKRTLEQQIRETKGSLLQTLKRKKLEQQLEEVETQISYVLSMK